MCMELSVEMMYEVCTFNMGATVAQLVRCWSPDHKVEGSTPDGGVIQKPNAFSMRFSNN